MVFHGSLHCTAPHSLVAGALRRTRTCTLLSGAYAYICTLPVAHLLKLGGALLHVAAIRVALLAVNIRGLEVLGCLLA